MKKVLHILMVLTAIFTLSTGVSYVSGWDVLPVTGVITIMSFLPSGVSGAAAFAGLSKEIWIDEILEKFYPDWSFLKEARDMSSFVENNTINLAEAGADPDVLINNTSYPVSFAERGDVPIDLPLDTYDTEGTVVRRVEEIETAYDKMQSVTMGHKNALLNTMSKKAAHAWAPDSDGEATPVIPTSGTAKDGYKIITLDDILNLATKFDEMDAPEGSRVLVLNPQHLRTLAGEDKELFKAFIGNSNGFNLFGFKVYKYSKTPIFDGSAGTKKAYGAASDSTDTLSSVAFVNTEVMKAQGTMEMFARLNDPEQKGDIINFQMRALALSLRSKGIGAIYSAPSV